MLSIPRSTTPVFTILKPGWGGGVNNTLQNYLTHFSHTSLSALVHTIAHVAALALLQRHRPKRIEVRASCTARSVRGAHRQLIHDGRQRLPFARETLTVGAVALHAERCVRVQGEQLVDVTRLRPVDGRIVGGAGAVRGDEGVQFDAGWVGMFLILIYQF